MLGKEQIKEMMQKGNRISGKPADLTPFYQHGRDFADHYWSSLYGDRHPTTTIRRLLKITNNAREYLDAKYGFDERLREITHEVIESGQYTPPVKA